MDSRPYEFDCGGAPFTVVSFDLRNRFANFNTNTFTSSTGGFLQVFGPATVTPGAGFAGITSFQWAANGFVIMDNLVIQGCTSVNIDIDIKPGSDPSSVNCKKAKGSVPVAIFGADNFDVSTIDLGSLELNGVPVTEVHNKIHIEDKNGDEFPDAVLHLNKAGVCEATSDNSDYPLKESADATLTGSNADGDFEGIGDIRIVKR